MTKRDKKGKTRRNSTEYPALNQGVNLNSRKEYIEPDYINGIYDKDGKEVIRPLTRKEKEWLNQFYEETIITNFNHDPDIRRLNKLKKSIIEDSIVQELRLEIKKLQQEDNVDNKRITELRKIVSLTKKQNEETYESELEYIENELQELRDERLLYPNTEDHKSFYNANNARNNCIFNKKNIMKMLVSLDTEEHDMHMMKALESIDVEDALILEIEEYEDISDRVEETFKEIKDIIKELKKKSKPS